MIDQCSRFNKGGALGERVSLGILDGLVDFYAAKYKRDGRAMKAATCDVIMRNVRTGLAATNTAISLSPLEEGDAEWEMRYPDFKTRKGIEWMHMKDSLKAVRLFYRHDTPISLNKANNPVITFAHRALMNASHDGWRDGATQTLRDNKNVDILVRNYVSMNFKFKGRGYRRLADPVVFNAARVEFAGIFSAVAGDPFVFADGLTERPNVTFVNIGHNAPATGQSSGANANVLLSQAQQLRNDLQTKMSMVVGLIGDISGMPSETDEILLPARVYDAAQAFLDVSVDPSWLSLL